MAFRVLSMLLVIVQPKRRIRAEENEQELSDPSSDMFEEWSAAFLAHYS